jgi:ubiquinone biosynthesis monooxygenase Coq7
VGDAGIVPAGAAVSGKPTRAAPRPPRVTGEGRLPGDLEPRQLVDRMIRVDHAGELGAVRIYEGQLAVLGQAPAGQVIRRMAAEERRHLEAFERLVVERRVRPTLLSPLWHVVGYALGVGTALIGERAAMACTVAVEEVIDGHYRRQAEQLGADEASLRSTLESFRTDELRHRDEALTHGAAQAPGHGPLTAAVKAGSRLAIWLSERL